MKRRLFSFLMALVLLVSMLPTNVIALTTDGTYELGESLWLPTGETPTAATVEEGQWVLTGETRQESVQSCGLTAHTHVDNCPTDDSGAYTCGGHIHTDACYTTVYPSCTAHSHAESCYATTYGCGLNAGDGAYHHSESCYETKRTCTLEESIGHIHGDSCGTVTTITCGIEEHEHDETCTEDCPLYHVHSAQCESVTYACGLNEGSGAHTHGESCYTTTLVCEKAESEGHVHTEACAPIISTVCGLEPHEHSEACATARELACGLEQHSHVTGGCGTPGSYTCGLEAHAHTDACSTTVEYSEWAVGYQTSLMAEAEDPVTYTVRIRVNYDDQSQRNKTVTIKSGDATVATVTTDKSSSNGRGSYRYAEVTLPAGTYTAETTWTSDNYTYTGTLTFTIGEDTEENQVFILDTTRAYDYTSAEDLYNSKGTTGYFNHVDVRVNGDFIYNGVTYNITLKDPTIQVLRGGTVVHERSFTSSTTYEWRMMQDKNGNDVKVYTTDVVKVTFDIYYNGKLAVENYTVTYSGKEDFIYAIQICDAHQGLDFRISEEEIIEAALYQVSYQWTGLPDGLANLPATTTGYDSGSYHDVNTSYTKGQWVYDIANGVAYQFSGWQEWSDADTGKTAVADANSEKSGTQLQITSDTIIYGVWTSTTLEHADTYLTITKKFEENDGNLPTGFFIRVTEPDGDIVDIDLGNELVYSEATGRYTATFPLYLDGEYTITEHGGEISGYEWSGKNVAVTVADSQSLTASSTSGDSATATVTVKRPYEVNAVMALSADGNTTTESEVTIGTVDFTNTYTKKTAEERNVYPDLGIRKVDADSITTSLYDAQFTLYTDESCTDVRGSVTIDETGYGWFNDLPAGTYYLKETKAPAGYVLDSSTIHTITVELVATEPNVYDAAQDAYITVNTYGITGASGATSTYYADSRHLQITNEKQTGSITLNKSFVLDGVTAGSTDARLEDVSIVAHIHGPYTADELAALESGTSSISEASAADRITISGSTWTATKSGLEQGYYLIHEVFTNIHGYDWSAAASTISGGSAVTIGSETYTVVQVNAQNAASGVALNITNNYTPWTAAHFYVHKLDEQGSPLSGAEFTLYESDGTTVADTKITDATGYVKFDGFTTGDGETKTYYLKETKAPAGYRLDSTVYTVTVTENGTYNVSVSNGGTNLLVGDTLTVTNEPILGSLTVKKEFSGDLADKPVIYITAAGPDGYSKTIELNGSPDENGETGAWTAEFADLKIGTYTVSESDASVPGYTLNTTYDGAQEVTITTHGQVLSLTITNNYTKNEATIHNPGEFYIIKGDAETHAKLAGAEFTLYDGDTVIATKTTDADGKAVFSGLSLNVENAGATKTYILKETKAPEGYALPENAVWNVVVKEKDGQVTVQVNKDQNLFESIYDWFVDKITGDVNGSHYASGVLTVHNDRITGSITLNKTIEGAPTDSNVEIIAHIHGPYESGEWTNAGFSISDADATTRLILDADGKWTATKSDLEIGYYLVHEAYTHIPGYDFKGAAFTGDSTVTIGGESYVVVQIAAGSTAHTLNVTNTYEEWDSVDLLIHKEDAAGNALHGAAFTLYTDAACTNALVLDGVTTSGTTGASGILEFGPFGAESDGKTYYLKETAPAGYQANGTVYEVVISNETDTSGTTKYTVNVSKLNSGDTFQNDTLTVINTPIAGQLTITKKFDGLTENLPAVTFTVTGPNDYSETVALDGTVDETETTAWQATLTNLAWGTYTVTENRASAAVTGYDLTTSEADTVKTVTVSAAQQTLTADFTNTYTAWDGASFTVTKVDAEDSTKTLSGVTFTLYSDAACETVIGTAVTGSNGVATFSGITGDGTYYLKETATLENYVLSTEVWTVTVTHTTGTDGLTDYAATVNGSSALTVTNRQKTGTLVITKAFGPNGEIANELPEADRKSILIDVTGPDGYKTTVALDGIVGSTETAPWTATLTGLKLGEYTVTENTANAAIPGYELHTSYSETDGKVTITEDGQSLSLTITNTYDKQERDITVPVTFAIDKYDGDDKTTLLSDAEFTLYDGTTAIATQTTNGNGRAEFSISVDPEEVTGGSFTKTFTLKETTAPEGYLPSTEEWKITVALKNGEIVVSVNQAENVFESIYNWFISKIDPETGYSYTTNVLNVYNTPTQLTITKTEAWYLDGKEVSYTDISAYRPETDVRTYEFTVDWTKDSASGTETASIMLGDEDTANDTAVITGIPEGAAYTVTEAGGDYVTAVTYGDASQIMDDAAEVTVTNSYYYNRIDNHSDGEETNTLRLCVDVLKYGMGGSSPIPLAGAQFKLTASDGSSKTVTSDSDGMVELDFTAAGTYTLTETKAPDGYALKGTVYTIEVEQVIGEPEETTVDGATIKVIPIELKLAETTIGQMDSQYAIANDPLQTISVRKIWDDGDYYDRPTSVKVDLIKDGKVADTVTLNEKNKWTYTWDGLDPYADWDVKETEVPDGYTSAVITEDGENLSIVNTREIQEIDVSVKKVWDYNKEETKRPDSVKIVLYRNGAAYETVTLSDANNWRYTWKDLPDNYEWTVDEKNVPTGFYRTVTRDGNSWVVTNRDTAIPKTGDPMFTALTVMCISAAALAMLVVMKKKSDKRAA